MSWDTYIWDMSWVMEPNNLVSQNFTYFATLSSVCQQNIVEFCYTSQLYSSNRKKVQVQSLYLSIVSPKSLPKCLHVWQYTTMHNTVKQILYLRLLILLLFFSWTVNWWNKMVVDKLKLKRSMTKMNKKKKKNAV